MTRPGGSDAGLAACWRFRRATTKNTQPVQVGSISATGRNSSTNVGSHRGWKPMSLQIRIIAEISGVRLQTPSPEDRAGIGQHRPPQRSCRHTGCDIESEAASGTAVGKIGAFIRRVYSYAEKVRLCQPEGQAIGALEGRSVTPHIPEF